MKKIFAFLFSLALALLTVFTAYGADGKVIYSGDSGEFIFEPGCDYSPTDLFSNFKGVMPGDSLTQKITVKNHASKEVKVKIYMRSLGAHEGTEAFLSQLELRVKKSEDNEMAYMFDATADETAQLTDWVCLGTLYSGGEVNLDVILDVPKELDDTYSDQIGFLDWEFKVEEFPTADGDPTPPTGDTVDPIPYIMASALSLAVIFVMLLWNKKRKKTVA